MSLNSELFADDTSLFSFKRDRNLTAKDLNDEIQKIRIWADQWKMCFNPDHLKQAEEVNISRKHAKSSHPVLLFINNPVQESSLQRHFGMILDRKTNFLKTS